MIGLDVDVTGHLLQRTKDFQFRGMHTRILLSERVVGIHVLIPIEGMVHDGERSIVYRTAFEGVDVAGVDVLCPWAGPGTWPSTRDAFPIHCLLSLWTRPHAGPTVFQQVFRTVLDAGGSVGILPVRVCFPGVGYGVVALHRRTLQFAHTIVVEVGTCLRE